MQQEPNHNNIFTTFSTPLFYSKYQGRIALANQNQTISLIDEELRLFHSMKTKLDDKPWSLKMKDNVLIRGSCEGSVTLWDIR